MSFEYLSGDKVISIQPRRREALFSSVTRIEAYWEGLRDGRLMPSRSEIDPRGISDVLEFAFILERIAPGLARMRLAGMHLNELLGMEVRGMPISAMFLPEARPEIQRVLNDVMESPAVVRLTLGSDSGLSRPPLEAQMILMPLRDENGRATRILGALQARGEIGRGPRRFMIRDIETKTLLNDPLTVRRPLPAFKEPAEPRPHLTEAREKIQPRRPFAPKTEALARRLEGIKQQRAAIEDELRHHHAEAPEAKAPRLRLVYNVDNA